MIKTQQRQDLDRDLNLTELLIQPGIGPCISIVIGLQKELNQRKQNATLIQHAVQKAHAALDSFACPTDLRQLLAQRLDNLVTCVNPDQPETGLGLFVSTQISTLISFPFQVNEIVLVGNSFETRDILYLRQYLTPYYIVSLAKTSVHLFKAHADSMQEIRKGGFPFTFEDDYEYSRSTVASSVGYGKKGFEKDKSIVSDMRGKSFVSDAANHLGTQVGTGESEIVVCGPSRLVNDFANACSARDRIVIKASGTHHAGEFASLLQSAWKACQASRSQRTEQMIQKLDELGLNYKAVGLRDVWAETTRGNGLQLLVERDYQRSAYIPEGAVEIRLHPPTGNYTTIADAVDDLIEKVLTTGGKVLFTEANQLRKFEQVALMLRHK